MRKYLIILVSLIVVIVASWNFFDSEDDEPSDGLRCTADAKLCPDGSYVGRDSENGCAFRECSEIEYCDITDKCENDGESGCYLFPGEDKAYCYSGDPCSKCDSGKCSIAESYPMQVFCE